MLNRLKNLQLDYCLIFASLYLLKSLIVTISMADAIIMLGALSLYGFKKYLDHTKTESNVKLQIEKLEKSKFNLDSSVESELKVMKEHLSKISLNQNAKTIQNKTKQYF